MTTDNAGNLRRTLAMLAQNQLLVDFDDAEHTYGFQHSLIRAVAYDQMTQQQRQELHRNAANAIEHLHEDQLEMHYAALANHWSTAGAPASAVRYADLASVQALSSGAYFEADHLLRICIDFSEQRQLIPVLQEQLVRWHRRLAEAHEGMGQLEARGGEARRALGLAGIPRSARRGALSLKAVGRGARLGWHRFQSPNRPPNVDADLALALEAAESYRHSAAACWFSNDWLGMICDSVSAAERAAISPNSAVFARSYAELGAILCVVGARWLGERILGRAQDIAAASDDSTALAYVHLLSCLYSIGVGDWPTTDHSATLCLTLCERVRDLTNLSNVQGVRFWLNHHRGHVEAAQTVARDLQEIADTTGNRQHQAWALRFLAVCDLRLGNPAAAAERLETALEVHGDSVLLNERLPIVGSLALARLLQGETVAAHDTAQDGLTLLARVQRPLGHATLEGYSGLTQVVLDALAANQSSAHWQRAAKLCLRALERYRSVFPIGQPRYLLWRSHFLHLTGRPGASKASRKRAVSGAKRLGMSWEEAQCADALLPDPRAATKFATY